MTTTTRPVGTRTTSRPAADHLVVVPAPATDALMTPWTGAAVRPPAVAPVRFTDLPVGSMPGSGTPIALSTPWQFSDVRPLASAAPVDFSGLAAPVASAALPRPRTAD